MVYVIIIGLVLGYFLGSINPAIILSKIKGKDIRTLGSGNAGATNTLRNFGTAAAIIVTLCDVLKCIIAILLSGLFANLICPDAEETILLGKIMAAVGCILGHNFPVYFKFKGGKGILVSAAALFMLNPIVGGIALTIFIIIFAITKYVSLGSIISAAGAVVAAVIFRGNDIYIPIFVAFAATLTIIRHRTNIVRLIKGEESKTTFKKK